MVTNSDRAQWAQEAVNCFAAETGTSDEDLETQCTDLLCNLMHLAKQNTIDFTVLVERASIHFDEEVSDELSANNGFSNVVHLLNKGNYHFVVNFPLNLDGMPGARVFDDQESLLRAHAEAFGIKNPEDIGCSINFYMTTNGYTQTGLNGVEYPVELKPNQSIEEYINNWVV